MTAPLQLAATTTLAAGTSTGEAFQFWILGTVAVIGALCTVFMKKAVHSALCLAGTMIILAVFYLANGAYFLGVVQIVVYTGAIMMLFLFVVMLVGVTAADSLKETIKGQRWLALLCGLGFGILLFAGIGNASSTNSTASPRPTPAAMWRASPPSSSPSTSSPSKSPALC